MLCRVLYSLFFLIYFWHSKLFHFPLTLRIILKKKNLKKALSRKKLDGILLGIGLNLCNILGRNNKSKLKHMIIFFSVSWMKKYCFLSKGRNNVHILLWIFILLHIGIWRMGCYNLNMILSTKFYINVIKKLEI